MLFISDCITCICRFAGSGSEDFYEEFEIVDSKNRNIVNEFV